MDCRDNRQHRIRHQQVAPFYSGAMARIYSGVDIGKSKFAYDLWGDTVNIASRMESSGTENAIQVSDAFYQILKGKFRFSKRGTVRVKGIGEMETYYLLPPITAVR